MVERSELKAEAEAPVLSLTPQQQAEDIKLREVEFNKGLQALCAEHKFAITVARVELPNGFVYNPQLMDTKFMPNQGQAPVAVPETESGLTPEAEERSAPAVPYSEVVNTALEKSE